jgi:hypothetical protein
MKRIFVLMVSFLLSFNVLAQQSYICIADSSTGFDFNKTTKKWYPKHFDVKDSKYVLSRKNNIWEWKEIGQQVPMIKCGEFDGNGYLYCSGIETLRFNKNNLRFLLIYNVGYVTAGVIGVDGEDSPAMTIGKCSPM